MRFWEWLGKASDAEMGETATSGTGQSGTVALESTATLVMSNAQSIRISQQTSSGNGQVTHRVVLPVPVYYTKLRARWFLRQSNSDATFDQVYTSLLYYDATNVNNFGFAWNSNGGVTKQIQYLNSAGTYVHPGFSYPANGGYLGASWHEIEMDVDISTPEYLRLQFDGETDLTAKAARAVANTTYPCIVLETALAGDANASSISIDQITLDLLEG